MIGAIRGGARSRLCGQNDAVRQQRGPRRVGDTDVKRRQQGGRVLRGPERLVSLQLAPGRGHPVAIGHLPALRFGDLQSRNRVIDAMLKRGTARLSGLL